MSISIEHRENPPQRYPITATIDLSESWDLESQRDILIKWLKEVDIYGPNLLFRGFDGNKINSLLTNGTDNPDSPIIFCSEEADLVNEDSSALDFALEKEKAGLAIYDRSNLQKVSPPYEYKAIEGTTLKESLLAVLTLLE